jgi:hypothetical protein
MWLSTKVPIWTFAYTESWDWNIERSENVTEFLRTVALPVDIRDNCFIVFLGVQHKVSVYIIIIIIINATHQKNFMRNHNFSLRLE